jgi:hypothetical protein
MRFYVGENDFADGTYMARFEYEVSLARDQEVPPPEPAEGEGAEVKEAAEVKEEAKDETKEEAV